MDSKQALIFEAARLCHEFGLSQREVAETLGVSPSTVTRLLNRAKELGIIRTVVQLPEDYLAHLNTLAMRVKDALKLKDVKLVGDSPRPQFVRKEMAQVAGEWLTKALVPGANVGFSGGRSIAELVPQLSPSCEGIHIVQLMGGVSSVDWRIQADVVARHASAALRGTCHVIHGPAILPSAEALAQLCGNPVVAEVTSYFTKLDLALVGIGTLSENSPLMQSELLTREDVDRLAKAGAIGEICGRFFDRHGHECEPAIAGRTLAISLQDLARTPDVCAVAAGLEKVPAIIALSRSGIIRTLVTDIATAEGLLAVESPKPT